MSTIKGIKEKLQAAFRAHMQALKDNDTQAGSSLIEVLIAVTIILIMMTFIGLGVANFIPKAQITAAKNNISTFLSAANAYYLDKLKYPDAPEKLLTYINKSELPKDPWGHEYFFEIREDTYYIASDGPNGIRDDEDDITSLNYANTDNDSD